MARTEATSRDNVDVHPEQGFQVLGEPNLVEEGGLRVEVHQQIDVAGRSGIASGDRTEHSYPRRVTPLGNSQDRLAPTLESVNRRYDLDHPRRGRAGRASLARDSPGRQLTWREKTAIAARGSSCSPRTAGDAESTILAPAAIGSTQALVHGVPSRASNCPVAL
jgi:hypothetical protein